MIFNNESRYRPLSNSSINKIIEIIKNKAKVKGKISTHSFRTTWATLARESGKMSLKEMQEQLGHKSIEQTSAYIKISRKKIDSSFIPRSKRYRGALDLEDVDENVG